MTFVHNGVGNVDERGLVLFDCIVEIVKIFVVLLVDLNFQRVTLCFWWQ